MKAKLNKTWIGATTFVLLMAMGIGYFLNAPVNSFTMDINPSIEIISNRLEKVVEIKPLNEDAEALLLNYTLREKDLEKVVDDLVDLMILTGYISGGQDNKVTITVTDEQSQKKYVDKVNQMITAYLENKQIEAVVMTQIIDSSTNQNDLTIMADGSTQEKLIEPTSLLEDKQVTGIEAAKKIALGLVNGEVIKLEFDDDDNDSKYEIEIRHDGKEYEIEIDAYTGKVIEFEKDDDEEDSDQDNNQENNQDINTSRKVIGFEAAKKIALDLVNGQIIKFEFDDDDNDSKYEIEIIYEGREYEIEIDAYTGKVIEFEKEDEDEDDEDDYDSSISRKVIGAEAAKKIALDLVNGQIIKFEFDDDDHDSKYEIEIIFDGLEYEIEIDAYTGKVLEFEKEEIEEEEEEEEDPLLNGSCH